MFNTHYYKKGFKNIKPLTSVNDSIVFAAIPYGKVICADDITRLALQNKENDGIIKNQKDVEAVLKGLIENGWVGELFGMKLDKFIKTL